MKYFQGQCPSLSKQAQDDYIQEAVQPSHSGVYSLGPFKFVIDF